jgi:hypothetical protein
MLPLQDGGPLILFDAPDRIPKSYPGCGECILSIARLNRTDDKYLQLFTRDEGGGDPVKLMFWPEHDQGCAQWAG